MTITTVRHSAAVFHPGIDDFTERTDDYFILLLKNTFLKAFSKLFQP